MTNNYVSTVGAAELDEKMTRQRSLKPFTRCVQCSLSRYVPHPEKMHVLVCKKPQHRQTVISPYDRIAGCPFAKRHTNYDAFSGVVVAAIEQHKQNPSNRSAAAEPLAQS